MAHVIEITAVRPLLRYVLLICVALFACAGSCHAWAQAEEDAGAVERRVKAAFLYKFAGYVEWPKNAFPRPDSPVAIAVIGDDQLAAELSQLTAGRTVEGRPVVVTRVKEIESSLTGAHIVFIGRAETPRLARLDKSAQSQPMLIVTESEGALAQGSIINFAVIGGRVRFEISLEGAEKRGLKLSSRLLAVAQSVRTGTP